MPGPQPEPHRPRSPGRAVLFVRYASPQHRYKERKIALTPDWIEAFDEYMAQYHPADQIFPWSQRRLEYLLEDLGEEAGLKTSVLRHVPLDLCVE